MLPNWIISSSVFAARLARLGYKKPKFQTGQVHASLICLLKKHHPDFTDANENQ